MEQLHLVGFTADHEGLIFSARKGAKSGSYVVPLDAKLLAQIEEALQRRDGDVPPTLEGSTEPADAVAAPARPRLRRQSALTPREIQARIRGGRTIAEVATEANVGEDWVARFAVPVLAEQDQMVDRATRFTYSKPRLGTSSRPLGESVAWNVADKGILLFPEQLGEAWSAYQQQDGAWAIRFSYVSRRRTQRAEWLVDFATGTVTARNRLASELGYVERGRRQGPAALPTGQPPAAGLVTADETARRRRPATRRRAARATTAKRTPAAARTARAAQARKGAAASKAKKAAAARAKKASAVAKARKAAAATRAKKAAAATRAKKAAAATRAKKASAAAKAKKAAATKAKKAAAATKAKKAARPRATVSKAAKTRKAATPAKAKKAAPARLGPRRDATDTITASADPAGAGPGNQAQRPEADPAPALRLLAGQGEPTAAAPTRRTAAAERSGARLAARPEPPPPARPPLPVSPPAPPRRPDPIPDARPGPDLDDPLLGLPFGPPGQPFTDRGRTRSRLATEPDTSEVPALAPLLEAPPSDAVIRGAAVPPADQVAEPGDDEPVRKRRRLRRKR